MIGEIRKATTEFYNRGKNKRGFKTRPTLVIARADESDYVILPISRVTDKTKIHPEYDVKIDPAEYPKTNLKCVSYVRTHKQIILNARDIGDMICNLKETYTELYTHILAMREKFSRETTYQALR